jgi:transposase
MPEEGKSKRHRTEDLRNLVSSVRNGTFHYEGKPKKSLDWSSYDEAQVHELADILELIRDFVDEAAKRVSPSLLEHKGRVGRPPCPPADVAKTLLLQSYFGVSNRVAAGLVRVFKEKLRISNEFSYKTIERGYDPSPVTVILQEVFKLTNEFGNAKETTFSTDGNPSSMKVNYESVRSEQRRNHEQKEKQQSDNSSSSSPPQSWPSTRHDFQYTESTVGVHTKKIIAGFRSTDDHSIGELTLFPEVMAQAHSNCPQMDTMLGDSLYASRNACAVVSLHGAKPYFLPRSNSTFRSHGVPAWSNMTHEFVTDPQAWLSIYHMRSISETVNSMEKRRFPSKLRKKLTMRKDTEAFLRQDVHNLRQYSYLSHLQPDLIVYPMYN